MRKHEYCPLPDDDACPHPVGCEYCEIGLLREHLARVTEQCEYNHRQHVAAVDALARVTAERDLIAGQKSALSTACLRAEEERDAMTAEANRLLDENGAFSAELAETKAALEALRMRHGEWLDKAETDACWHRDQVARLRKAWALFVLEQWPGEAVEVTESESIPPDVAALIRAGAGQDIGKCTRCEQRAPLAWLPNGQTCAWGCAKGGESDGE